MTQNRKHTFDASRIPPENILDLRTVQRRPAASTPDLERQPSVMPKMAAPRPSKRSNRPKVRTASHLPMLLKAWASRFRVGSFPIVAAGSLLVFAGVISVGSLLEVRSRVLATAQTGLEYFRIAGAQAASQDLEAASATLVSASETFRRAEEEFATLHPTLVSIASRLPFAGSKISSGQHVLAAARLMADAGADFAVLAKPLTDDGQGFSGPAKLVAKLESDRQTLNEIVIATQQAVDELSQVDPRDLPDPYGDQLARIRVALPAIRAGATSLTDAIDVLADLLGTVKPREHLFVFQNSNELRPTGGFIGSFALIEMNRGEFHILDAPDKGSFGVDEYMPETITPPLPLQVITPSWYFRDANWFPDYPTSARQLSAFYEQARGFKPRSVVAVTNGFLERMLTVTGPITLDQYGLTVDATNITQTAQEQSERQYDLRTNDPKRFVVDLIPMVATKLSTLDLASYPKFLAAVAESVQVGDLQFWSSDTTIQSAIKRLGWSAELPAVDGDILELVNTNIGGGKTDGVVQERVGQRLTVGDDGRVRSTVTVTRTHTGQPGADASSSRSRTYHRLYVPLGSKLVSASGFDQIAPGEFRPLPSNSVGDALLASIEGRVTVDETSGTRMNEEFGRTVFGNWSVLDPGQTKTWTLVYDLPDSVPSGFQRYDLTVGHQAGSRNQVYGLVVDLPKQAKVRWTSDSSLAVEDGRLSFSSDLRTRLHLSFVLQR